MLRCVVQCSGKCRCTFSARLRSVAERSDNLYLVACRPYSSSCPVDYNRRSTAIRISCACALRGALRCFRAEISDPVPIPLFARGRTLQLAAGSTTLHCSFALCCAMSCRASQVHQRLKFEPTRHPLGRNNKRLPRF